jgi:hypothetical protein
MRFVRPRRQRRLSTSIRAISVLVSVVVVAALAQAGQQYVWCRALQQVMPHSCCVGEAPASAPTTAAVSEITADCCQVRSAARLDAWTPAGSGVEAPAPFIAILADVARGAGAKAHSAAPAWHDPTMRTGPPQSRVLAQLMVFRI